MLDDREALNKLSDGIPNMPRRFTERERLADRIRICLLFAARLFILPCGVLGLALDGIVGGVVGVCGSWILGRWVRYSLGVRGREGFHGWYQRIRERANGSGPGLLEHLIELIRGSGFSDAQCRAIIELYDEAMIDMRQADDNEQRINIAMRLDIAVKRISYIDP